MAQPGILQENQNKRYGSSIVGSTAKDLSNVVGDTASALWSYGKGVYSSLFNQK